MRKPSTATRGIPIHLGSGAKRFGCGLSELATPPSTRRWMRATKDEDAGEDGVVIEVQAVHRRVVPYSKQLARYLSKLEEQPVNNFFEYTDEKGEASHAPSADDLVV